MALRKIKIRFSRIQKVSQTHYAKNGPKIEKRKERKGRKEKKEKRINAFEIVT